MFSLTCYFLLLNSDFCFSLVLHGLNHLKQLLVVGDFDVWPRRIRADDIDRGCVLDADRISQLFVGVHLSGKFSLRIYNERNIDFMFRRKLLDEALQVVGSNFRLVLEAIVAELIAEIFALPLRIKVARPDRCLV